MEDLIVLLATGKKITDENIETELLDICDKVHASCDDRCPVYRLNGSKVPDTANDFDVNRGCDCFKSGKKMLEFIRIQKLIVIDKRKEIASMLIDIFNRINIDTPSNFDEILEFVYSDVEETADKENWHDGDVAIGFRRWIEKDVES